MSTTTEPITLQTIVRSIVDTGETDPDTIASKATEEALAADDVETIIWGAAHFFARREIRHDTRLIEEQTGRSHRPRPVKLDRNGRPIKATSDRAELLSRTIWIPKKGRVAWGLAELVDLTIRADYMRGQLAKHTATVTESIEFIGNVSYFLKKNRVNCLADYPSFAWELIPGFSPETLQAFDEGDQ